MAVALPPETLPTPRLLLWPECLRGELSAASLLTLRKPPRERVVVDQKSNLSDGRALFLGPSTKHEARHVCEYFSGHQWDGVNPKRVLSVEWLFARRPERSSQGHKKPFVPTNDNFRADFSFRPMPEATVILTRDTQPFRKALWALVAPDDTCVEIGCSTGEASEVIAWKVRKPPAEHGWLNAPVHAAGLMSKPQPSFLAVDVGQEQVSATAKRGIATAHMDVFAPAEFEQLAQFCAAQRTSVVAIDIGGNRDVRPVLELLEQLRREPRLAATVTRYVVKCKALHDALTAAQRSVDSAEAAPALDSEPAEASAAGPITGSVAPARWVAAWEELSSTVLSWEVVESAATTKKKAVAAEKRAQGILKKGQQF